MFVLCHYYVLLCYSYVMYMFERNIKKMGKNGNGKCV